METIPLKTYKSHIQGKNADVSIYRDRIEWSITRTGRKRVQSAEMMPVKAISSVTCKRSRIAFTEVVLVASGNTVEIRLTHGQAEELRDLIHRLMLDGYVEPPPTSSSYSSARAAGAVEASRAAAPEPSPPPMPTPPPVMTPPPPPPPPPTPVPDVPAGWHPDPAGRHEVRYWNGYEWTEHVSNAGEQAADPMS